MSKFLRRYSTLSRLISNVRTTGENITGHAEVLLAQKHVKEHKDALKAWRNELALAIQSYEEVQHQLKRLYTRKTHIYQDQKRDLAILQAINDEEESLLFKEQESVAHVEECKQKERETFEALSDAIQDSHEKERAQSERMKYYTRIGSLLGAFFGFLGSNFFIRREIRQYNLQQSQRLSQVEELLTDDEDRHKDQTSVNTINSIQEQIASIKESVDNISKKVNVLDEHSKQVLPETESTSTKTEMESVSTTTVQNLPGPGDSIVLGGVISYALFVTLLLLL